MEKLILLLSILSFNISNAQLEEDNRTREQLTSVSFIGGNASLRTIDGTYYVTYLDMKYQTINSTLSFTLGDIETLRNFRKSVLKAFGYKWKDRVVRRFTLDDKQFVVGSYTKNSITIKVFDRGIEHYMGTWNLKRFNKLIPEM